MCAWRRLPSQAKVTSTKSSSSLRASNWLVILAWKLFQRKQNCCWLSVILLARLPSTSSLSLSLLKPRAPHHPPSSRLSLLLSPSSTSVFFPPFLSYWWRRCSFLVTHFDSSSVPLFVFFFLTCRRHFRNFRMVLNMKDSLRRRGWGWSRRSGLFYCTLVLLVRDEALITLEKKWQVQKVQSMTEEEVCTWGESIGGLPTLRNKRNTYFVYSTIYKYLDIFLSFSFRLDKRLKNDHCFL